MTKILKNDTLNNLFERGKGDLMLVSFSCSNVRSIKDKTSFTMESSADKSQNENLIYDKNLNKDYLRFSAVFGENGSGKTSFLVALSLLHNIVLSNPSILHGQPLFNIPHKLSLDEPTSFEIVFIQNEIRYRYFLEYKGYMILKEQLEYWPNGRVASIFERNKNVVTVPLAFTKINQIVTNKCDTNKLILVLASQETPYKELKEAISFFTQNLVIFSPGPNNWFDYSANQIEKNPETKRKVLDFLNSIGVNAKDIKSHVEQRLLTPNEIPLELGEQFRQLAMNKMATFSHLELDYGDFSVDYNEESSGIQSLLQFLCPLFDIFENGKIFVCDEIEQHLHPTAIRKIIEIFNSNKKSNAQVILTTHDIDLLDTSLLRRDQIWFSYMKENHSSELFRLSDLRGVRKDDNLKKNYLEGNYKKSWIDQQKKEKNSELKT